MYDSLSSVTISLWLTLPLTLSVGFPSSWALGFAFLSSFSFLSSAIFYFIVSLISNDGRFGALNCEILFIAELIQKYAIINPKIATIVHRTIFLFVSDKF